MYEDTSVRADDAASSDRGPIDDYTRAQADGATVPHPAPPRPGAGASHARQPASDPHGNWSGRTPW